MKAACLFLASALLLAGCATTPAVWIAPYESRPVEARYYLHGDSVLFPDEISDDGEKTYIHYRTKRELPAIFGMTATGDDTLVNGHVRGEAFVIDEVYQQLRFRLGKAEAEAFRQEGAEERQ